MAIIYTYPSGAVKADDLILVSEQDSVGTPTKNITVSDLANFITSTGSGVGITNFIPIWTDGPNGLLGNSILQQDGLGTFITCQGGFQINNTLDMLGNDIINVEDFKIDGDIYDVNGNTGVAGEVLSSLGVGNGVEWTSNGGTVTGTGTTDKVTKWTDGPNGVLGDSSITDTGILNGVEIEPAVGIKWTFAPGSTFSFNNGGAPSNVFEFKNANDGYYDPNFRFTGTLAIDRSSQATGASLDVGIPANPIPAAWFRNGVVVSNNPSGVTVDNTSVVIGAGNNDIVSGSDNCLAVGNNNQMLADSDHSLAIGQGNTMTNADNSIVVGQQNTLTGNRLYVLGFSNALTCASSFAMGGDNGVEGTQNQFAIGYNHNLGTPGGAEQKQIAIGTANSLSGTNVDQGIAIGNNLTADVFSNYQTGILLLGKGNTNNRYDVGTFNINPAVIISGGTGVSSDAIIVTNSGGNISQVVLPEVFSNNNFVDDAAAAAGGVPKGGIYHNAGALRIRIV